MSERDISIKWVLIGAAVIIGINRLLFEALDQFAYAGMVESMGEMAAGIMILGVVAVGSFFVGGVLIGWASPGETLKEPAIAATIAIVVNFIIVKIQYGQFPNLVGGLVAVALAYALGLLGARVGERIQGETTEKMRERGELGNN